MEVDYPGNFFEYIDSLFSQDLPENTADSLTIKDKGDLLRMTRFAIRQMHAEAKSELDITVLLLPERYKLSELYRTLPTDMDEKQKALAMRWILEAIKKNPDKLNLLTKRTELNRSLSDKWLSYLIIDFYGRLSEREVKICIKILYSIWDSGDGHYDSFRLNE